MITISALENAQSSGEVESPLGEVIVSSSAVTEVENEGAGESLEALEDEATSKVNCPSFGELAKKGLDITNNFLGGGEDWEEVTVLAWNKKPRTSILFLAKSNWSNFFGQFLRRRKKFQCGFWRRKRGLEPGPLVQPRGMFFKIMERCPALPLLLASWRRR